MTRLAIVGLLAVGCAAPERRVETPQQPSKLDPAVHSRLVSYRKGIKYDYLPAKHKAEANVGKWHEAYEIASQIKAACEGGRDWIGVSRSDFGPDASSIYDYKSEATKMARALTSCMVQTEYEARK